MQYPNPMILTTGSSPLARGLHGRTDRLGDPARIIPARAGFTTSGGVWAGRGWDHPRSRGVYADTTAPPPTSWGSSPLARGLLGTPSRAIIGYGIIPARAGFTRACAPARAASPDHPRSRGVYSGLPGNATSTPGSSPLARGLRVELLDDVGDVGIIPARAGFTPRLLHRRGHRWDHPRSRGVYDAEGEHLVLVTRIIPARAGFTLKANKRS